MEQIMRAYIIAVGSELLTPQRVDTNSLLLTEKLLELGVEVVGKAVVGDDRRALEAIVEYALRQAELTITTGGLGPTEDDVTREAVAAALGRRLVFSEEVLGWIEAWFHRAGRKMSENNRRQAYLIEGATALPNPNGTAPGQWIEHDGRYVLLLPGPPRELQPMFDEHVLKRLRAVAPPRLIRTRVYRVAGLPEATIDSLISPIYREYTNPVTTILAAPGDGQIQLRASGQTEEQVTQLLDELGQKIEQVLGHHIYSREGQPLEVVVGDLLRARQQTVAVAESCTAGLVGGKITSVPGSSDYFLGGFLVYTNELKHRLLGVDRELLETRGAVCEPVAAQMAEGVRSRLRCDYGLSVTGIAGPEGGTAETPVGTVFIGVASARGTRVRRFQFSGDRERVRVNATQAALNLLRLEVLQLGAD